MTSIRPRFQVVRRSWLFIAGLAFTLATMTYCLVLVVGCCATPNQVCADPTAGGASSTGSADAPACGITIEAANAIVKAALDDPSQPPNFKPGGDVPGDHAIFCQPDSNGNPTLRVLSNDNRHFKSLSIESAGVLKKVNFGGRTYRNIHCCREYGEITKATYRPEAELKIKVANVSVMCGEVAKGEAAREGQVGWNIMFDNSTVCMTALHVLAKNGDLESPPTNFKQVHLGQATGGTIPYAHPILLSHGASRPVNYWDVALAAYPANSTAMAAMLGCASYPTKLASCGEIPVGPGPVSTTQIFHFVDATDAINGTPCVQATLAFVGAAMVTFDDAGTTKAWFENQLGFTPISKAGDSGGIIFNSSNEAVGLQFAITTLSINGTATCAKYTVACPIYAFPWIQLPSQNGLPTFGVTLPAGSTDCIPPGTKPCTH